MQIQLTAESMINTDPDTENRIAYFSILFSFISHASGFSHLRSKKDTSFHRKCLELGAKIFLFFVLSFHAGKGQFQGEYL